MLFTLANVVGLMTSQINCYDITDTNVTVFILMKYENLAFSYADALLPHVNKS